MENRHAGYKFMLTPQFFLGTQWPLRFLILESPLAVFQRVVDPDHSLVKKELKSSKCWLIACLFKIGAIRNLL